MNFKFERLYVLLHVLSWAILFCIPFIGRDTIHTSFLIRYTFHLIFLAFFFYLNMHILIPKLLFQKQIGMYAGTIFLFTLLIVAGNLLFDFLLSEHVPQEIKLKLPLENSANGLYRRKIMTHRPPGIMRIVPTLFSTLLVFGVSTSLKLINEYLKKEKKQNEIEHEKLNSELAFLKSQINPHFLFNTLNNIYSLASTGSPNTEKAIMKLSELMRYMLEETEDNKVELSREIEYIQTYLELQKLRLHESVTVQFTASGDFNNKQIEPMLLIPFIENPFKHGISYNESSYIRIDLNVNGNKLKLVIDNSIPTVAVERDKTSGIGLSNVKKRLKLLYPDKHRLNIKHTDLNFHVNLELEL